MLLGNLVSRKIQKVILQLSFNPNDYKMVLKLSHHCPLSLHSGYFPQIRSIFNFRMCIHWYQVHDDCIHLIACSSPLTPFRILLNTTSFYSSNCCRVSRNRVRLPVHFTFEGFPWLLTSLYGC